MFVLLFVGGHSTPAVRHQNRTPKHIHSDFSLIPVCSISDSQKSADKLKKLKVFMELSPNCVKGVSGCQRFRVPVAKSFCCVSCAGLSKATWKPKQSCQGARAQTGYFLNTSLEMHIAAAHVVNILAEARFEQPDFV